MSIRLNDFANPGFAALNLTSAVQKIQDSLERLSSGSRIQKTSDDAGGSAVSLKFGSAIRRTEAVFNNLLNLVSFLQVQDAALNTLAKGVTRMMELKTLSLDPSKSATDLQNYSSEFSQIRQALVDISVQKFNGVDLFSHSGADTQMTVGADDGGQIQAEATQFAMGVGATSWLSPTETYQFVQGVFTWDEARNDAQIKGGYLATITSLAEWTDIESQLGADSSKCVWIGGFQPEGSPEPDVNWQWVTGEPFIYTNWEPGEPSNSSATPENSLFMSVPGRVKGQWNDGTVVDTGGLLQGYILEIGSIFLSSSSISALESALQYLADCQAKNGASINAANRWLENARTHSINLEAANSKVADVDVAGESTKLSRANVLAQFAASALAQGNAAQSVLVKLLNG